MGCAPKYLNFTLVYRVFCADFPYLGPRGMIRFFILVGCWLGTAYASDGRKLFRAKCMLCHAVRTDLSGPALQGVEERVPDKELLYAWIRNNKKVLASGNPYFTALYEKWNRMPMNVFEDLTDEDISAILAYVKQQATSVPALPAADTSSRSQSWAWYVGAGAMVLLLFWYGFRLRKH